MILVIDSDMAFAAPIQSVLTTAGITAQIVHERYHGIQPILMAEQHRQAIQSIFVNLHPKTRPVLGPSLLIAKLRVIVPHARITAQTDDPAVA